MTQVLTFHMKHQTYFPLFRRRRCWQVQYNDENHQRRLQGGKSKCCVFAGIFAVDALLSGLLRPHHRGLLHEGQLHGGRGAHGPRDPGHGGAGHLHRHEEPLLPEHGRLRPRLLSHGQVSRVCGRASQLQPP